MATRRVSVFLELLTAGYNKDAAQTAAVTRRVSAEMEKLGDETDEVSRDMTQLTAATAVAKRQVDDLGDEALGAAASLSVLDARIMATRRAVHGLGLEFARTGDTMDGVALDKQRSLLNRLERLRRQLTPDPNEGGFANVSDMLSKVPTRMNMIGGGVAAVVGPGPISPVLGAGAAGLGAGLIGTAGVAGGLLMAAKDANVIAAAKTLGDSISAEFFRGADAFVRPALQAMTIIDQAFKDMHLPEAFAKMAPHVNTIAGGLGDLGKNIMPGLNKAFDRMGPFAAVAAEGMGDLGEALGTFMDEITASEGAVMGLDAMFKLINGTIILTGAYIHMLSDAFMGMVQVTESMFRNVPFLGTMLRDIMITTGGAPETIDPFVGSLEEVGEGADIAAQRLKSMNDALDDLIKTAAELIPAYFSMEELQDRAADTVARLTEQIKEQKEEGDKGAGSLDRNTQAGRDNADMVRDLTDMYGDMIIKTAEAGGDTDALERQLRNLLLQMGFNKAAVDHYVGSLDLIPAEKITMIQAQNAQALAAIQETDRELNRLYDRTITLTATFRQGERASSYVPPIPLSPATAGVGGREGRRASGGAVLPGIPYMINERGFETVTFPASGMVHPANLTPMSAENFTVTVLLDGQAIEPRMVKVVTERDRDTRRRVLAGV